MKSESESQTDLSQEVSGAAQVVARQAPALETYARDSSDLNVEVARLEGQELSVQVFFEAGELDTRAKALEKEIVDGCVEIKQTTHKAWKAAVALEGRFLTPVQNARERLRRLMARWHQREQAEAATNATALLADQQSAIQAQRDREVMALRASGQDAAADDLAAQPLPTPVAPATSPTVTTLDGISFRKKWIARILDSERAKRDLFTNHPGLLFLLDFDQAALNRLVAKNKGQIRIDGIAIEEEIAQTNRR